SSPAAPKAPTEADKAQPGEKGAPPPANLFQEQTAPNRPSPQAIALKEAAKTGTPFCEKCEAARKAASAHS
ncbi:MAG TPA: hypothetical protein PKD35_08375, partial [Nitrosomonas sp.]|nr:hypothetical protein [Nitrosomonas sp.]